MGRQLKPLVLMMACASMGTTAVFADEVQQGQTADATVTLNTIRITASADASADGLMEAFAGGQVASGGRVGIFGNQKNLDTPFNLTSYTNDYIQSKQAKSVGDVLQADPSVRVARGFGNFQESYYIRGFILGSDDTAYNGLYSILPRQYIPTELFERVELLKGASAFLNGATPSSGGIGGAINLLPKRAGNEPLNRVTVGTDFNGGQIANDISRRFGENQEFGVRVNTAYRGGNTSIDDEKASLGLASIGLDYRGDRLRLSGDMGYSNNRLNATRPNITLSGVSHVPKPIDSSSNYAQKWTYSNEEDVFGSYRAEYDLSDAVTAYAAYGFRHGEENNSLANFTLTNAAAGDGTSYRFDNARVDMVNTGEIGVRAKLNTGAIEHNLVLSGSAFQLNSRNAYVMDYSNTFAGNIYRPTQYDKPTISSSALTGGQLDQPTLTARTRLRSIAVGDNLKAFDERLSVMLGLRYQQLKQENYNYDTQAIKSAYDDHKVTPALGLSYKLMPELAVYANYVEALSQGSSATSSSGTIITNTGEALSPYISKQKEVGLKYEGEKLGAALSYFNTNRQRGMLVKNADETYTFTNQGENRHQGVELQTYGQLTDTFKVLGGVTWLDAKQKDTENGLYNNNDVIGVPQFQANLGADWQLPIEQDISVNGRVIYTGSSYANNANTLKVNDWTRFDLGASYKTQLNQVPTVFNLTINNVFDKNYWGSVGGYDDAGYLNAGQPRTFMMSASFDF
ncbi:TonB-dependent receptor [Acinetobacter sp. C26M]|uniref:TonB-dependent receptor n=1 Tax=unclassified Acinetobacter TaxID=196816 RepID=UPI0020374654|nr:MULTISPECIES: TonB-dependent receptor [unclassified Acinetobacter]USA45223.1 TonB-dependent receptor [Acinetobacter sp. C26M]USA48725.1 TonB-dependent receptor [Acinetobacter sp. C26G]